MNEDLSRYLWKGLDLKRYSVVRIVPQDKEHAVIIMYSKVAGYARVSTDSEEQLTSYEAQVDYYTRYIRSRPDWQFVDVYTDEGISATNTKRREGFNRMVQDALDGKIDLIVTKSVSRFARNTVDSLTTVRKLKDAGVEVYFEKENIWTLDSKGELLITIMSSLAQEESRSISENVTWGQRKRFADGKVSIPYTVHTLVQILKCLLHCFGVSVIAFMVIAVEHFQYGLSIAAVVGWILCHMAFQDPDILIHHRHHLSLLPASSCLPGGSCSGTAGTQP